MLRSENPSSGYFISPQGAQVWIDGESTFFEHKSVLSRLIEIPKASDLCGQVLVNINMPITFPHDRLSRIRLHNSKKKKTKNSDLTACCRISVWLFINDTCHFVETYTNTSLFASQLKNTVVCPCGISFMFLGMDAEDCLFPSNKENLILNFPLSFLVTERFIHPHGASEKISDKSKHRKRLYNVCSHNEDFDLGVH